MGENELPTGAVVPETAWSGHRAAPEWSMNAVPQTSPLSGPMKGLPYDSGSMARAIASSPSSRMPFTGAVGEVQRKGVGDAFEPRSDLSVDAGLVGHAGSFTGAGANVATRAMIRAKSSHSAGAISCPMPG